MKPAFYTLFAATILAAAIQPARAEQYLALGAGWFDITRGDDNSAQFAGEWHGNRFYYGLLPVVGVNVNTDGGTYGFAGLNYDFELTPHWIVTPGVGVGAWGRGHSIDLGGTLEFRESAEIDYRFDNQYRAGLQVNHTSNASIYSRNPGVNTLMATVAIPLGN